MNQFIGKYDNHRMYQMIKIVSKNKLLLLLEINFIIDFIRTLIDYKSLVTDLSTSTRVSSVDCSQVSTTSTL